MTQTFQKKRDPLLKRYREEILAIAAHRGAINVRVFGSRARGEAKRVSDLDLLIDLPKGSLWDLVGLKLDLEELLPCKVDVFTPMSISRYIRTDVLREAKAL